MLTQCRALAMHRPPRYSSQLARFAQSRRRLPSVRPNANPSERQFLGGG